MSQGVAAALRGTAAAGHAGTAAWEDVDGVTSRGGAGADFGWGSKQVDGLWYLPTKIEVSPTIIGCNGYYNVGKTIP